MAGQQAGPVHGKEDLVPKKSFDHLGVHTIPIHETDQADPEDREIIDSIQTAIAKVLEHSRTCPIVGDDPRKLLFYLLMVGENLILQTCGIGFVNMGADMRNHLIEKACGTLAMGLQEQFGVTIKYTIEHKEKEEEKRHE